MTEFKRCTKCLKSKNLMNDYYLCSGKYRSECRACTIKRNVLYQCKTKAWKHRYVDDDTRRLYMRNYYSNNKNKFKLYRIKFKESHPEYYKKYFQLKKQRLLNQIHSPNESLS